MKRPQEDDKGAGVAPALRGTHLTLLAFHL